MIQKKRKKWWVTVLAHEKRLFTSMAHEEKARHCLVRARWSCIKLCAVRMRNAKLWNDLNFSFACNLGLVLDLWICFRSVSLSELYDCLSVSVSVHISDCLPGIRNRTFLERVTEISGYFNHLCRSDGTPLSYNCRPTFQYKQPRQF